MITSDGTITKSELLQAGLPSGIDEVILRLEKIIAYCEMNNNCAGYFAMLYHKVTCKIRDCITSKDFEDGARMERLDVGFANRYLEAFYLWIDDKPTSDSWKVAFDAVADNPELVIQHLLAGMNAHINLDLGIATANIMHGFLLDDIHDDFNTINSILGLMIDNIVGCLTKINPLMNLLKLDIYKVDDMLVKFSLVTARDGAWQFATEFSSKTGADCENCIHARDLRIAQLGQSITRPDSLLLRFIVRIIRIFEKKNVAKVIEQLGD